VVRVDLEDVETIAPALQGAALVACCVGAAEDKPFDTTAPKRIDGAASVSLVEACKAPRSPMIEHFVLVTALGTGKFGMPASLLNLFWGVLSYKREAEEALERSGIPFTIVRPGGMERPKDDFKDTHATRLEPRDSTFGGLVSRLQVAEVVAACFLHPDVATGKVLEVVTEEGGAEVPTRDLIEGVPAA